MARTPAPEFRKAAGFASAYAAQQHHPSSRIFSIVKWRMLFTKNRQRRIAAMLAFVVIGHYLAEINTVCQYFPGVILSGPCIFTRPCFPVLIFSNRFNKPAGHIVY